MWWCVGAFQRRAERRRRVAPELHTHTVAARPCAEQQSIADSRRRNPGTAPSPTLSPIPSERPFRAGSPDDARGGVGILPEGTRPQVYYSGRVCV